MFFICRDKDINYDTFMVTFIFLKTPEDWNSPENMGGINVTNCYKLGSLPFLFVNSVFNMGNTLEDMQVGCAWVGEQLISVSLNGFINYLDTENPDKPKKIIKVRGFCLYFLYTVPKRFLCGLNTLLFFFFFCK